ncbi:MAG: hypothetical protein LBM73_01725, partial [Candidatus Nomurabacteria bacterium]|nr:hypothetical protein [Candidatus Nomurabacteria bacterium]
GIGTKRIETEAKRLFPSAKVARFDGDSTRGQTVAELYDDLKSGAIDIIIGTQQIAKGLDLPKLNLVGIVQADAGLNLPDFAASERTFQLISQAAGRVGRGRESTRVIVQTFQPQHPAVIFGARQNYAEFYKYEIQKRRRGHFPPFAHLLKLTCQYKTERGAINASKKLAEKIAEKYAGANNRHSENTCHSELVSGSNKNSPAKSPNTKIPIKLLGPTPAFYERARDQFRWQIIVRAGSRQILQKIAALVPAAHWQVELDPWSLL